MTFVYPLEWELVPDTPTAGDLGYETSTVSSRLNLEDGTVTVGSITVDKDHGISNVSKER